MRMFTRSGMWFSILGWGLCGCVVWSLIGCASNPQPPTQPTKQEIRTDADRFLDKLETEEGKRNSGQESSNSDR